MGRGVPYTDRLQAEYERLWHSCQIRPEYERDVDAMAAQVERGKDRYLSAVNGTQVPWWMVGTIHMMESGGSFEKHLHNGDPLTGRTVREPAGRPVTGNPPFKWEVSAKDALRYSDLNRIQNWDISQVLYRLEGYNGWGYRLSHPEVLSPYLWSRTNMYERGKYIADGKFSPSSISTQIGAAAIMRRLAERGIRFDGDQPRKPQVVFGREVVHSAYALQTYLNQNTGATLRVDGRPGPRTSDAFHSAFGMYLRGDPRGSA